MMTKISRLCRRVILKNFGSYKKFGLFLCIVLATLYLVRSMFLTHKVVQGTVETREIESHNDTAVEDVYTGPCDVETECPQGRVRYYIKSGLQNIQPPRICFNGKDYVGPKTINGRGVNLVVINELTMEVEDVQVFDTYESGGAFHNYLMENISDYRIIFFATYDDAAKQLQQESRKLLNHFGSTKINVLQYRDALVFVGQKGLTQGSAIEKYVRRYINRDFADVADLTGCLTSAVGKLNHFVVEDSNPNIAPDLNCGVTKDCGADAFSVHLYSGFQNSELPKICINGKMVMEKEIGRGINVVVFDPKAREVAKSGRFDTYEFSNTSLVPFLQSMKDGEIVLAVTHDEATTRLTVDIKKQFELLGSFYVSKLAMRDSWCFVGQRGLQGRSPFEELEFAPSGGMTWSDPVDRKFCIPTILKGFTLMPLEVERNQKRIEFCNKYVGYGEFCAGGRNDELIKPAALKDDTLFGHDVFSIPILLVPGANKNAFRMQLESLMSNPGIKQQMISVYFSDEFEEYKELIGLFSFKAFPIKTPDVRTNYTDLLITALQRIWIQHNTSKYVIVFEEEVMARKHYLTFLAQCFASLEADKSLIGISGWNENGYVGASNIPNIVYRTETFPGLGFLLKKSFYDAHMKDKLTSCCSSRSWEGWLEGELKGQEMIVPDTSFVTRRPLEETTQPELLLHLFNRPRVFQKKDPVLIRNKDQLTKAKYEEALTELLKSSTAIKLANITDCSNSLIPADVTGKSFAIYYEQNDKKDETLLSLLCRCFKLFSLPNHRPKGKHHGLIRFSNHENHVFLIGSKTEYYVHKPKDHQPVASSV